MIRIHRTGATILKWGLFITCIGTVMYPIAIGPMINPSKYRNIQSQSRKDVIQEAIQPGNMKVWSDPFGRKDDKKLQET